MSFIMRPIRFAPTGHIIEGSGLFDSASGKLLRTGIGASNRTTWSVRVVTKMDKIPDANTEPAWFTGWTGDGGSYVEALVIQPSGAIQFLLYNAGATGKLKTTQLFRDYSGYLDILAVCDTSNSTAGDRMRLYINGTRVTDFSATTNPSLNYNTFTGAASHNVSIGGGTASYNGFIGDYLAHSSFIDGQALDPTSFGEVTDDGFWQINDASGLTFGTNGFLIEGGSAMSAGTDSSGNSNDYTKSGTITATKDSPTNNSDDEYGNYPTINPLEPKTANFTLSNGNRTYTSTGAQDNFPATFGISSGKIYWEVKPTALGAGTAQFSAGIAASTWDPSTSAFSGPTDVWILNSNASNSQYENSGTAVSGITVVVANNTVQFAMDLDAQKLWIGRNNTWYGGGDPADGSDATYTNLTAGETYTPIYGGHSAGTHMSAIVKMQLADWTYDAPSGFGPLSTAVLSTPDVINYEDEYYIEAGISHTNGSTTAVTLPTSVSGGAMARIKRTDAAGDWHMFDTVRGANKSRKWNEAEAEDDSTFDDQNLTGTTLTLPSALASGTYLVEVFYVGSYFQIQTVTGNAGARTITWPTAMDSYGFSAFFPRTGASSGISHHIGIGAQQILFCDNNSAAANRTNFSQAPNKTDFRTPSSVGPDFNLNTILYVCYGWANSGPYAFGSYTGNGSTNGPVISYGGFAASYFAKHTSSANSWYVGNSKFNLFSPWQSKMKLDQNEEEDNGGTWMSPTSTGQKLVLNSAFNNGSGIVYIYGAFGIQRLTDGSINQGRAR